MTAARSRSVRVVSPSVTVTPTVEVTTSYAHGSPHSYPCSVTGRHHSMPPTASHQFSSRLSGPQWVGLTTGFWYSSLWPVGLKIIW